MCIRDSTDSGFRDDFGSFGNTTDDLCGNTVTDSDFYRMGRKGGSFERPYLCLLYTSSRTPLTFLG